MRSCVRAFPSSDRRHVLNMNRHSSTKVRHRLVTRAEFLGTPEPCVRYAVQVSVRVRAVLGLDCPRTSEVRSKAVKSRRSEQTATEAECGNSRPGRSARKSSFLFGVGAKSNPPDQPHHQQEEGGHSGWGSWAAAIVSSMAFLVMGMLERNSE